MIIYSNDEKSGFLSKKGVENLRSSFANSIFSQDMYCSFEKQTEYRDRLRNDGKKMITEIVAEIQNNSFVSPEMKRLIIELADQDKRMKDNLTLKGFSVNFFTFLKSYEDIFQDY